MTSEGQKNPGSPHDPPHSVAVSLPWDRYPGASGVGSARAAATPPGFVAADAVVVLTGAALHQTAVLVRHGLNALRRDGLRPAASAVAMVETLERLAHRVQAQAVAALAEPTPDLDGDVWLSTREAADLLGVSTRQTHRLAGRLGARRLGHRRGSPFGWPADAVHAEVVRRHASQPGRCDVAPDPEQGR